MYLGVDENCLSDKKKLGIELLYESYAKFYDKYNSLPKAVQKSQYEMASRKVKWENTNLMLNF